MVFLGLSIPNTSADTYLLDIQSPGKTAAENKLAHGVGIPASQAMFVTDLPEKSDLANHHQVLGGEAG
jgi:hypothetical protein